MEHKHNSKPKPVIVSGFSSQHFAEEIASRLDTQVTDVQRRQFDDKEIQTTIEANVRGREVIVVASAAGDPNKQEKEARLLMRAAGRSGAKSVTLVLPYMWYGRSDDNWDERNSPALIDTIETLREHCQNVVIADPHNHGLTREKFLDSGSPVRNCVTLHFAYPFAIQLKHMFNEKVLLPDKLLLSHADAGSSKRISRSFRSSLYNVLELDRNPDQDDWGQGLKDRDKATGKTRFKGFSTDVDGQDVVIFEDMIASGGTICELADLLKNMGARSVTVFATSGLFISPVGKPKTAAIDRINASCIDAVYITDTYDHRLTDAKIHFAIRHSPVIHTISTTAYTAAVIEAMHAEVGEGTHSDENSISAILRGRHPDQADPQQKIATPARIKENSPLLRLR